MSAPIGGLKQNFWQAGGWWHWLLKNLLDESVDHGKAKTKKEAQRLARESIDLHRQAALVMVCPEKYRKPLKMSFPPLHA